ncbi:MAG: hypothetical protein GXP35_12335 [Actinobacteria bacterium]|nr:hypothetical protein [Actinomycetota bacterium]
MEDFVDRHGLADVIQFPDESGELWRDFGVRVQPSWVIVPGDGSEPQLIFGSLGEDQFANYVAS